MVLYLFEAYLIIKFNNSDHTTQRFDNTQDSRTTLEIYKSLKDKEDIAVKFPPSIFLNENTSTFPLSGLSKKKTIFCNEDGFMSFYFSDRYGFNNPDDEWEIDKKIKIPDYVLLGDSFAHGACVNRPNDIASVLRTLSNSAVINLGYIGNGPLIEYAAFREYINFDVKNILFFFFEQGDMQNLKDEMKNKILKNYIEDKNFSQKLIIKQNEIEKIIEEKIILAFNNEENLIFHHNKFKNKKHILLKFIRLDKTKKEIKQNFSYLFNTKAPYQELKLILKDLNELAKESGSNFYFIYLPGSNRYMNNSIIYRYYLNFQKNKIWEILVSENIKKINIHDEVFKKENNPLSLFNTKKEHYNEKGYLLVAKTIYDIINLDY